MMILLTPGWNATVKEVIKMELKQNHNTVKLLIHEKSFYIDHIDYNEYSDEAEFDLKRFNDVLKEI